MEEGEVPIIATRFAAGVAWLLLTAMAQGSSGMTCDSRTIMVSTEYKLAEWIL